MEHEHDPAPPRSPGFERNLWLISIAVSVLVLVLSWPAFYAIESELKTDGVFARAVEAMYSSVQLLLMHVAFEELPKEDDWPRLLLHFARTLALIGFGFTAIALTSRFFGNEIRLRWRAWRGNHVVICGLTPIGRRLNDEFCREGHKVIVIHDGAAEELTAHAARSGAALLQSDHTGARTLHRAGAARAGHLFAALADETNVRIVMEVIELAHTEGGHNSQRLHALLHVSDPQLRASLRRRGAFRFQKGRPRITMFNVYENSARLLLKRCPLDHVAIGPHNRAQIVVMGFGHLGEAVLTRAAMIGHYANLRPLRAIVVDPFAADREKRFRARYPQLDQACEATFLSFDGEHLSTQSHIAELCAGGDTVSTVVICMDDDSRGLSVALGLREHLNPRVPIRLHLNEQSGLAALLGKRDLLDHLPGEVSVFGSLREACARKNWLDDDLDFMAKKMHEDFVRRRRESGVGQGDENMRPWHELDDELIDSNRQAADHMPVKVRAVGCHITPEGAQDPGAIVDDFTGEEVELLAKMEHQRWMAERFLQGWVYGAVKDTKNRISPYLVSWEKLSMDVQDYDRNIVRILPGVLRLAKQEIHR